MKEQTSEDLIMDIRKISTLSEYEIVSFVRQNTLSLEDYKNFWLAKGRNPTNQECKIILDFGGFENVPLISLF